MRSLDAAQVDRAIGALVGAACGDALGAGYEFGCAPLTGRPRMIGGGLGNFAPGEWTDDTAQTYAIAKVAATGADLRAVPALDAIVAGFLDWWASRPPDVGVHTRRVLSAAAPNAGAAALRAESDRIHAGGARTAGNGTLMRTAPVALAHLDDPRALVEAAVKVAELTHHDPVGGDACALWCLAIRHAVLEGELPSLGGLVDRLPQERRTFWREAVAEAEERDPSAFGSNGYVVSALQAAWSAIVHTPAPGHAPETGLFRSDHLVAGLEATVGVGGDTDTTASIAGAVLGARWGYSAIPWEWRRIVHGWSDASVRDLVDLAVLTVRGGRPDSQGWPGASRIDYSEHAGVESLARHPYDSGVYLSGAGALDDLPADVTAVVSLCRLGHEQIRSDLTHAEFRIIDTHAADNPNLEYAVDEAARAVHTLRQEGHVVLLHCVAALSRTPTVAARYGALLGRSSDSRCERCVRCCPRRLRSRRCARHSGGCAGRLEPRSDTPIGVSWCLWLGPTLTSTRCSCGP